MTTLVSGTASQIKATIEAVTDVGLVYDYDPYPVSEWDKYVANFSTVIGGERVIRAWTIKNVGRDTVPVAISSGAEVHRPTLRWLIRALMGVNTDGASDRVFRDLLEAVIDALNSNRSLTGAPSIIDHDPADYVLPNNGALLSLGDTICHYAEVTFASTHEIVLNVT